MKLADKLYNISKETSKCKLEEIKKPFSEKAEEEAGNQKYDVTMYCSG